MPVYVLYPPGHRPLVWILPPKTGTRSTEQMLKKAGGSAIAGRHGVRPEAFPEGALVVSNIRNPFDILVSWYHYSARGAKKGRPFVEFIDDVVLGGRNNYLRETTLPGAQHAEKYVRYENGLAGSVLSMLHRFDYHTTPFPHVGAADERKPYQDYYTPDLMNLVRDKYAEDFDRFNYDF